MKSGDFRSSLGPDGLEAPGLAPEGSPRLRPSDETHWRSTVDKASGDRCSSVSNDTTSEAGRVAMFVRKAPC